MIKQRSLGFTLIELLITIAIASLLLALAAPSFSEIIRNNRVTSTTNKLVAALSLARSEAIKRGTRVTLCKTNGTNACALSGDFSEGWIVFADADENAAIEDQTDIIRVYDELPTDTQITGDNVITSYVSYDADGIARQTTGDFQFGTIAICNVSKTSCIDINRAGRLNTNDSCSC